MHSFHVIFLLYGNQHDAKPMAVVAIAAYLVLPFVGVYDTVHPPPFLPCLTVVYGVFALAFIAVQIPQPLKDYYIIFQLPCIPNN